MNNYITAAINDTFEDTTNRGKPFIVRRKKQTVSKKNIHMILKGEDIARMDALRSRVHPQTQTEVIISSLQIFDALIKEYDAGATFYIKRDGDEEPVNYDVFS